MADRLKAAERALATHAAFERRDDTFAAVSTPFEATIDLEAAADTVRYDIRMELPTLDAVVVGETVASVVQEGWLETFDRRLADVDGALRGDAVPPGLDRQRETVIVHAAFESARPDHGADDAAALIGYVEGTYLEGIIPGYTYREPVAGLLEQARDRSGV